MWGVFLLSLLSVAHGAEWAVIVAGSNTYTNYRHQSDVCHAYQIAHLNGIPDDNIIVMQYDDIANNRDNPFPGQIFNQPTARGVAGTDVYAGCKKDYTGVKVTAANFIAVITGDAATAGGKVLESTENDNVFINFVDHGSTGIVAFPVGPYLTEPELIAALDTMVAKKMFAQLTFYVEACEAGSMFTTLKNNEKIYVTTASNAIESSWGTYCPPDDMIDGKAIGSCLGDLYSVNWMEDCDSQAGKLTETLQEQYLLVQKETDQSHVMQYGDLSFVQEEIGEFLGNGSMAVKKTPKKASSSSKSTVDSRDIPLHLAYWRYLRTDRQELAARRAAAEELRTLLDSQLHADQYFLMLSENISGNADAFYAPATEGSCGECCATVYLDYQAKCGGFDDYSMQYARVIHNLCRAGFSAKDITTAFNEC